MNYYIVGAVILVLIISMYLIGFIDFSEKLTEQKCIDVFSNYEPSVKDIELTYSENRAEYSSEGVEALFYFKDDFGSCKLIISENVLNGLSYECNSGTVIHTYAKEYENYYETELTFSGLTIVELNSKNAETEVNFGFMDGKKMCGGLREI